MHLPKAALLARGFGGESGFTRVPVHRKRKMAKDDTQTRAVILLELVDRTRKHAAGRTLEIAEFLECDRRIGISQNVNRFGVVRSRGQVIFGNCKKGKPFCPIEQRCAPKRK